MGEPFRVEPAGPAAAYQTYRVDTPSDVTIVATCQQVGCDHWRNGWDTIVDEATVIGANQAGFIRRGGTGRTFRELGRNTEGMTVFRFGPYQRCFADHRTRPQQLLVVSGDWRQYRGVIREHVNGADFMEDVTSTCAQVWDRVNKG